MALRARAIITSLLWVALLGGCASPPDQARPTNPVSVIFASNRFLELEPCGCSINPVGGLEREWNLLEKWKKEITWPIIVLTGGTTFAPPPKQYNPKNAGHHIEKGHFLLEALDQFKTSALGLTIDDLAVGLEEIRRLERKARFPFISSNITAKDGAHLFKPFYEITNGEDLILLLALSHESQASWSKPYAVKNPENSVREILSSHGKRARMVIILSSLPRDLNTKILEIFPEVHVILGGIPNETTTHVEQYNRSSLYANPNDRGQALVRLDFKSRGKINGLHNPTVAKDHEYTRELLRKQIEISDRKPKAELPLAEREKFEREREHLVRFLRRSSTISSMRQEDMTSYETRIVDLDERLATPKNVISGLIERYKKTIRSIALEGQKR